MRHAILTILAATLLAGVVQAKAPQAPLAPQAPACHDGVPFETSYVVAAEKAARENKPLCVWVSYKCPSSANQLPGVIHVFVPTFQGDATQRVVCGVPDGKGWLNQAGVVKAADCCASSIEGLLETRTAPVHHTPAIHVQPTGQPVHSTGGWNSGGMMRGGLRMRGGGACAT